MRHEGGFRPRRDLEGYCLSPVFSDLGVPHYPHQEIEDFQTTACLTVHSGRWRTQIRIQGPDLCPCSKLWSHHPPLFLVHIPLLQPGLLHIDNYVSSGLFLCLVTFSQSLTVTLKYCRQLHIGFQLLFNLSFKDALCVVPMHGLSP